MASSQSMSPWPLLAGGAVAAGALWWLSARRAQAATRGPTPGGTPASVGAEPPLALPAPEVPSSVVTDRPVASAPVSMPAAGQSLPTMAASDFIERIPFVPPAIAAAVATATAGPAPAPPAAPVPASVPPSPAPTIATAPAPSPGGWIWPLLRWREYEPVISDGWGSPRDGGRRTHRGADLMYRRRSPVDQLAAFPARAPHSAWHFLPPGTIAVAARDGEVWSAGRTPRGHAIVLTHADGWVTYYQHLAQLFIPALDHGTGKIRVRAGQALGIVGADPTQPNQIAHLHFELRRGTRPIDPRGALQSWRVLDRPTVLPEIATVVTPPAPLRDPREDTLLARIYREHGRGLPVAYLTALGRAESGGNAHDPRGVLNITRVALDEYNRKHPAAQVAVVNLRDPATAVSVASWVLRQIIASYRAHHPETPNLREDWSNPQFVALLTAGWNAGHSETSGVGYVARWLAAHGLPVTIANVFGYAARAGAAATLRDPNKRRFAERVTKAFQGAAGAPS